MAFTVTARQAGNSGETGALDLTTSSATPTADSLFLVCWGAQANGQSDDFSFQAPVGGGLSYTQVVDVGETTPIPWDGSANFRIGAVADRADVGGSPTAFQVTVDAYAGGQDAFYTAICLDITGHDGTTPIAQSATNGADGGQGDTVTGTVTLESAPSVGSLVVAALATGADDGGGFATPTLGGQAMTVVINQDASFCQGAVFYRVIDGTESNDTITCTDMGDTVGNWTMIAVEVNAESGGATDGTAAGSYAYSGTATGQATVLGSAAGSHGYSGTATGQAAAVGAADGSYAYAGTAEGQATVFGSASGSYGYDGMATGQATAIGSAAGSYGYAGTATGEVAGTGSASGTYGFSGTAEGRTTVIGSASGSYGYSGTTAGSGASTAPTPIALPPYREPPIPDYQEAAVPAYRERAVPAYQESAS